MKRAKSYIKNQFSTGKKPVQENYADWIDSFVHLDDQAAVDNQIVNQLLVTYDLNLKTRNVNGPIDSLGDVYYFLQGQLDSTKLSDTFSLINWQKLPNKPSSVAVSWDVQEISTDTTRLDPQQSTNPLPGWLLSAGGIGTPTPIVDIRIERRWISIPNGGSSITFYVDQIVKLKVAINLKATL